MSNNKRTSVLIIILAAFFLSGKRQADNVTAFKPRSIWTADWSADGKYIAVGGDDSTIWIYNGKDYSLYRSYKTNSMVKGISFHPRENLLAIANMKGVQLLDIQTGTLAAVPGLETGGRGITWSPSGDRLALADGNGIVQIMDKQGKIIRSIKKHNNHSYMTVDWHPTKPILVTGSDEIIVFDTAGTQLSMFRHRKENTGVLTVRWHPSGAFFASGDYGHEDEGMPTLLQFWKQDGTLLKAIPDQHHREMRNLRWSPDGSRLATASDALRIWDKEGKLLHTATSEFILWGLAWSRDNKFIVTGAYGNGAVNVRTNDATLVKTLTDD